MDSRIKHTPTWRKTSGGGEIELWKMHHRFGSAGKNYLFIGGVHGDEPEGVHLAQSLLARLRSAPASVSWTLIPCLNPDGLLAQTRVNFRGVDLNRNFPAVDWQPAAPKSRARYFPGEEPLSEIETQAVVELLAQETFSTIFHFHSWKPEIIVTGPENLREAEALSRASGHPIKMDTGYPTPGSLGQYGWLNHQTPVICIEEEEKISRERSWQKFGTAFEEILGMKA